MKRSNQGLFWVLAILACFQTLWWAYLITHQQQLIAEMIGTAEALEKAQAYRLMISAEGLFFLFVWSFGFWFAYRSHQRDLKLQKLQSDFLGAITHELKTPLANVRLCLDTLERPNLDPEMRAKYFTRAQGAIDKLVGEVDLILAVSSGRNPAPAANQRFDLTALIDECLKQSVREDVQVKFGGSQPLWVAAPYHESRLIFSSLLDNAIKYSLRPSDGPAPVVAVSVETAGNSVRALIADNGVGLTEEERASAFLPFFRSDRARGLDPSGTGLGLTLVQRVGRACNVDVQLESKGAMKGTTAIITWPMASARVEASHEASGEIGPGGTDG